MFPVKEVINDLVKHIEGAHAWTLLLGLGIVFDIYIAAVVLLLVVLHILVSAVKFMISSVVQLARLCE